MKRTLLKSITFALAGAMMLSSCSKSDNGNKGSEGGEEQGGGGSSEIAFYAGSDISWVTEMEKNGKTFRDNYYNTELFRILKNIGQNIVRFRVWVNPEDNWCGYADVLDKCMRAKAQGMSIIIDFHYSDFFADPGKQNVPQAWNSISTADKMAAKVAEYTRDFLDKLKLENIEPEFVQIGNETTNGMLWPIGKLYEGSTEKSSGWKNYIQISNAGYDAAKTVFPSIKCIVHIDCAYKDNRWWFEKFLAGGGKVDIIGLSHYPQTADGLEASAANTQAINNISALASATNKEIMVVETGIKSNNFSAGASLLGEFVEAMRNLKACKGVLYWEPEVYGDWKPAIYTKLGWNAYDMGAFNSDGSPSEVIKLFRATVNL